MPPQTSRRGNRGSRALVALLGTVALVAAGCGGTDDDGGASPDAAPPQSASGGDSYEHVHGLGINPRDGSLMIATHTGLFRAAAGGATVKQVGTSRQDVMGFTVVGPDRFLGSGHPGPGQSAPPHLGLISSANAGVSWTQVSLLGEADFHVLRAAGELVYGFDASNARLMVSADRGRTWKQRSTPGGVFDLAPNPRNPNRVIASTERGIAESENAGKTWRIVDASRGGLLVWSSQARLFLLGGDGRVQRSADSGRKWRTMGSIDGQPAAFVNSGSDLYAARADATVLSSGDGGRNWQVRTEP